MTDKALEISQSGSKDAPECVAKLVQQQQQQQQRGSSASSSFFLIFSLLFSSFALDAATVVEPREPQPPLDPALRRALEGEFLKFDGDKNESYLLDLFTSDKGILQHVGENHGHNIRFLYKNEDDSSPKLQVSTDPGEDHQFELTLTFSNFYEGSFVRFTHKIDGNSVIGSHTNTGTFRFYNRIQLY